MPPTVIDNYPLSGPSAEGDRIADCLAGTAYRAVRLLGQGSMGQVVEAERIPSSRELVDGARAGRGALPPDPRVVVKLLHVELADRPDLADRLRLEAEVLASLDHPNIVKMHELGATPAGRPFLVMERLVGSTLREELDERGRGPRFPIRRGWGCGPCRSRKRRPAIGWVCRWSPCDVASIVTAERRARPRSRPGGYPACRFCQRHVSRCPVSRGRRGRGGCDTSAR